MTLSGDPLSGFLHSMSQTPASHRTMALLALVLIASRGLSYSRGNLQDVGVLQVMYRPDSSLRHNLRSVMFGSGHRPPRPPRYEPALLVGLAVLIATVLTVAYAGVSILAERLQQGGG